MEGNTAIVKQFTELLRLLALQHPEALAAQRDALKSLVEPFPLLPPDAACGVLAALWPLARQRADLQDMLVLVLRKSMFSSALSSR